MFFHHLTMKEEKTRKTVLHISPLVGQKLQIRKVQYITDIFGTFSIEKIYVIYKMTDNGTSA